jgi:hypothetical protein
MNPREIAQRYAAQNQLKLKEQPEQGELIGARRRPDGGELRLTRHEYQGHKYYRLAVWDGAWPVKGKQISIRASELGDIALWLQDVMEGVK